MSNTRFLSPKGVATVLGVALCLLADRVLASGQEAAIGSQPATSGVQVAKRVRPVMSFDGAMILPIRNEITDVTFSSVERRLKIARAEGRKLVIFELDTPGGALGPTLEICGAIRRIRSEGVATYAWVNHKAYSAGTIIALATDGIVMAPNATMGDCQPIRMTETGFEPIPEALEAKTNSPLIEELRDSARQNGYDLDLIMSLVRPELQIFWLVDKQSGERRFADARQRDDLFGWSDRRSSPDDEPVPDSGSNTSWRYVRDDPLLGPVRQPVDSARELLTMRDQRAQAYGLSMGTVGGDAQLRTFLNVRGPMERSELTTMEHLVGWLASPMVRAVLFMLMLLAVYAEFHAPGIGLPGAVALICLTLFLGAPYLAGITVTWEITVILAGLVLLGIELFVIPGFGVIGIAGFMLLGFGLLSSFAPPEPFRRHWFELPQLPLTYSYLRNGLIALSAGFGGALVGMYILARYLPRAPIFNRIIAANPAHEAVTIDDPYHGIAMVGDVGRTETLLRPAGKARFGPMLVDVVSEGDYIAAGEIVEVVERSGSRVVVRESIA